MAGVPYLKYSYRGATQRSAGRYEYTEVWMVPDIQNTVGPEGAGAGAKLQPAAVTTWQHEALNSGIPAIGDQSGKAQGWTAGLGGMVVASIQPRSLDDQGTATIDIHWQEDPLTLPTEVHYFTSSKIKPALRGLQTNVFNGVAIDPINGPNNNPRTNSTVWDIRNSANTRFNPPVTYEAPLERIEITCRCSLAYHDQFDWSQYVKRWNSRPFTIVTNDPDNALNTSDRLFPKIASLFLADKRAPLVKEPYLHRLLTLTFLYDPDTWAVRVADMGPVANFAAPPPAGWTANWPTTGLCPVVDMYGHAFGGLAELDGHGKQLFPTTLTDPTTMPAAVIYAWWPVASDGFSPLAADFNDFDLFTPERILVI